MRKLTTFFLCLLAALLPLAAQNNPYEIDDVCYECLRRAEDTVDDLDTDEFEQANARLLEQSIVRHDEKARTLYYVFALRRLCRKGEAATPERRKHTGLLALRWGSEASCWAATNARSGSPARWRRFP